MKNKKQLPVVIRCTISKEVAARLLQIQQDVWAENFDKYARGERVNDDFYRIPMDLWFLTLEILGVPESMQNDQVFGIKWMQMLDSGVVNIDEFINFVLKTVDERQQPGRN